MSLSYERKDAAEMFSGLLPTKQGDNSGTHLWEVCVAGEAGVLAEVGRM